MFRHLKRIIYQKTRVLILRAMPDLAKVEGIDTTHYNRNTQNDCRIGKYVGLYSPYHIADAEIGDYTYIAHNSHISIAKIGKFCSIGPNVVCGWGIHPTHGISTSPMFYSTMKQNGMTLSTKDKVDERKGITIGNDVFIGANVTILDGVTIGDGAVIGAGSVVSKDIPPYAVAAGCPIKILRYRFDAEIVSNLLDIKWWNFDEEQLWQIEKYEFDVEGFIKKQQYEKTLNSNN